MREWNCEVSLEVRDMYVLISYTGKDIVDVAVLRDQVTVMAEEYALTPVWQTESNWVSPGRIVGEYSRNLRVAAYPSPCTDEVDVDDDAHDFDYQCVALDVDAA